MIDWSAFNTRSPAPLFAMKTGEGFMDAASASELLDSIAGGVFGGESGLYGFVDILPKAVPLRSKGCLDIKNTFAWTINPQTSAARINAPTIILTEKRLIANTIVSQLSYGAQAARENFGTQGKNLAKLTDAVVGEKLKGSSIYDFLAGTTGALGENVQGMINAVDEQMGKLPPDTGFPDSRFLQPYKGLYVTEKTGFRYIFPFINEFMFGASNSFSDGMGSAGFATEILKKVDDSATQIATLNLSVDQYKHIEKVKTYNFGAAAFEDITISFPLFNTMSYQDLLDNWSLLYLLSYQNTPGRKTKTDVEMPVIYDVLIPGVKHIPYAFIKSIQVKMKGIVKPVVLDLPAAMGICDSGSIVTNVPEVYEVTIQVTALVSQSKNMFQAGTNSVVNTNIEKVLTINQNLKRKQQKDGLDSLIDVGKSLMGIK